MPRSSHTRGSTHPGSRTPRSSHTWDPTGVLTCQAARHKHTGQRVTEWAIRKGCGASPDPHFTYWGNGVQMNFKSSSPVGKRPQPEGVEGGAGVCGGGRTNCITKMCKCFASLCLNKMSHFHLKTSYWTHPKSFGLEGNLFSLHMPPMRP